MRTPDLQRSVAIHKGDLDTPDEWALSVASLPGEDHLQIVGASEFIRNRVYKVTTGGVLFTNGYQVVADDPPHALIILDDEPTEESCEELRNLFEDQYDNPFFEERDRRGT